MRYYPLNPRLMALACRQLARDMRAEAEAGEGPITLVSPEPPGYQLISRHQAAQQAARWQHEAETGVPNHTDREKMGW